MQRRFWLIVLAVLAANAFVVAESGALPGQLDNAGAFSRLARRGFAEGVDGPHLDGGPDNSYAWAMAWFNGKLYVGTNKDVACFLGNPEDPKVVGTCPPAIDINGQEFPLPGPEQAAQIWAYTPRGANGANGTWRKVYESPMLLRDNAELPVAIGYRNAVVCPAGDGVPRLYFATFGFGGRVIYTDDGVSFHDASVRGLDLTSGLGLRPLICFKSQGARYPSLYTSPVGVARDTDASINPVVLANSNPASQFSNWQAISQPGFGNAENLSVFSMATWDTNQDGTADYIVANASNRTTGLEVWITNGACSSAGTFSFLPCQPSWTNVLKNGAGRSPVEPFQNYITPVVSTFGLPNNDLPGKNSGAANAASFKGDLYLGVADAAVSAGVGPAEIIRIRPDFSWDLIVGYPRSPQAMATAYGDKFHCQLAIIDGGQYCRPLSSRSAGFGSNVDLNVQTLSGPVLFAPAMTLPGKELYFWSFGVHSDGYLYVGTLDATPFDLYGGGNLAGASLLRTNDGESWSVVDPNGFGNPSNVGIRNIVSTPIGLAFGTANPSTNVNNGNNTGGAEVWLGTNMGPAGTMHVGDLDVSPGLVPAPYPWRATLTVTVHDSLGAPLSGVLVRASWTANSSGTCTTDVSGRCSIVSGFTTSSAIQFEVTNLLQQGKTYAPLENNDPEGDSNGTTISVTRQ